VRRWEGEEEEERRKGVVGGIGERERRGEEEAVEGWEREEGVRICFLCLVQGSPMTMGT